MQLQQTVGRTVAGVFTITAHCGQNGRGVFTVTADCGHNGRRIVYSYSRLWAEL